MEAFIKRRIPGKTTCSKALQYNSNKVVIKLKLYQAINYTISKNKKNTKIKTLVNREKEAK